MVERSDIGSVRAVVVGEPSSNELYIAEKGALWIRLATHGKTAHGSMPELGRNAVTMMVALLSELDCLHIPYVEHPLLGGFTRSINTLSGGVKTNVVPDRCEATIDMRTVPGQDHSGILSKIQELIRRLEAKVPGFRASVEVMNDRAPVTTALDHPIVSIFAEIITRVTGQSPRVKGARYYTDAAVLVPAVKASMVIVGPGEAALAHQPDEYVEVCRLVEATKIYLLASLKLLT